MSAKLKVGIVGLGDMGGGMADRLLAAGYETYGYNRTRAKAAKYEAKGMKVADSPRAVAQAADLVITMVTNNDALQAVFNGPDGILAGPGKGKIVAEMSTTSPTLVRELAKRVAETGATLLDAPVSGSIQTLREGKLLVMVGGPRHAYDRAEPAFLAIGPKVRHVGDVGQAKALKVGVNLSLAVQMLAFSEGVLIAEKMGVDRRVAAETLLNSVIASPMLQYRAPFILDPPSHAWFTPEMMQKDMQLALDLGREFAQPLPATAATQEVLSATRGMGYTKEDFAVLFHALAKMGGIERDPASIPDYARESQLA
ncbi:MAG TPA: NAD(P)-dependent oxidoreductase [Candidatus Limnocylindria bacterium]|jgi:3-hydroxyisobutyrate dehydrogenase-like beta-hydroxyacid dehydrogenase|nr:NAD(P)-dependent oxidoreductase [Candidatus Limnocylindria bacterium]